MRLLVLAALLLAPLAAAVSVPPLGEFPADWSCNSHEDVRVCAGADTGGTVQCTLTGAHARCTYTFGWIVRAWSEDAEDGNASYEMQAKVRACSSVAGCTQPFAERMSGICTWLPTLDCGLSQSREGEVSRDLVMGECYHVSIPLDATMWAHEAGLPIVAPTPADASFTRVDEAAGEVCLVDDGR